VDRPHRSASSSSEINILTESQGLGLQTRTP
jgi:hypothetical protein